jgi:predicted esterase
MLSDHSVDPKSGEKPEYLVIFFHGYGSNGELMAQHVGNLLGPLLPEARIRCPDGPIDIYKGEDGTVLKSWFELRDLIDGDKAPDTAEVAKRATVAAKETNDYINEVLAEEGIPDNRVIIAGFSQGGTMAFYTALLRDKEVAGVYSLSGGALDQLQNPVSKPPVGLVAGGNEEQDYSGKPHALKTHKVLDAAGFRTDCVIIDGQGHDISWKSMELLSVFARAVTKEPAAEQNHAPRARKPQSGAPKP